MICRCAKGPKASQIKNEMVLLSEITRFNQLELGELQTRFARMAKNSNFITKTQFRDNLGLLGLGTMLYISDRIFDIMDDDRDGKVSANIIRFALKTLLFTLTRFAMETLAKRPR